MADFDAKAMIKRIESVLAERGMSKEEFYAKSKVSSASFSQWNTGTHKPTPKKIFAVAQCLGVSVEWLKGETNEKMQKEKPTAESGELDEKYIMEGLKFLSNAELLKVIAEATRLMQEEKN